tara:strand:+ start:1339 stop:2586 length:1248 start_codon:yes stop_codon:yes gene_type:complete
MDNLNSYIYKELNYIPYNIYPLIEKYLKINKKVKVAFVGGFIRDLLIKRFHSNRIFETIDYDLVIEGSSLSLAKFIKQNIKNVKICLIKEFELYNTVELNIDEIKIDIASAREEKYLAPGENPSVIDTSLKDDLKRRDFSINAIAYEVSTRKVYDPFDGINHIKKKELHLLHKNSIKDDPSRLLRCSKYASRLGFKISNKSLIQAQRMLKEWPWEFTQNEYGYKFPPGISIRIRMELSEILKFDCLTEIIKKLAVWKSLALLNEDIEVNNKFIRGLNWLNRLKGNAILYLIKDSKSLEISSDRFFINQKEKRYLKDFLEIKKYLKKHEKEIYKFTPSEWTKFIEERNLDAETVKLLISDGVICWRFFLRWLIIYRYIKSKKNGKILKEEGWNPGKKMGEELKRLRYIEIDNHKKY